MFLPNLWTKRSSKATTVRIYQQKQTPNTPHPPLSIKRTSPTYTSHAQVISYLTWIWVRKDMGTKLLKSLRNDIWVRKSKI